MYYAVRGLKQLSVSLLCLLNPCPVTDFHAIHKSGSLLVWSPTEVGTEKRDFAILVCLKLLHGPFFIQLKDFVRFLHVLGKTGRKDVAASL